MIRLDPTNGVVGNALPALCLPIRRQSNSIVGVPSPTRFDLEVSLLRSATTFNSPNLFPPLSWAWDRLERSVRSITHSRPSVDRRTPDWVRDELPTR